MTQAERLVEVAWRASHGEADLSDRDVRAAINFAMDFVRVIRVEPSVMIHAVMQEWNTQELGRQVYCRLLDEKWKAERQPGEKTWI